MAIAKVGSAGGSAGAIGYVLRENKDKSKKPEILAGSFGTEAEIKREFEIYNKLNKRVKNQATHISVSFHPDEHIKAAKKVELAETLLEKLGFQNVPYLVVEHHDKDYEHFHIVAGRIRDDGTTVKEWKIADRAIKATKELEKHFGIKQVEYTKNNDRQIKHDEYKQMERTGELSVMAEAKLVIDETLNDLPKTKDFVEHLQKAGFEVRPNISESSGKMNGFSFKKDEITFKSSAIAKNYSWKNLQKNGLDYEEERDKKFLIKIKKQEGLSNELTDKRAKESRIRRFEEEIENDRINSSRRTDEQSSTLKPHRAFEDKQPKRTFCQRSGDEISQNQPQRITGSSQVIGGETYEITNDSERFRGYKQLSGSDQRTTKSGEEKECGYSGSDWQGEAINSANFRSERGEFEFEERIAEKRGGNQTVKNAASTSHSLSREGDFPTQRRTGAFETISANQLEWIEQSNSELSDTVNNDSNNSNGLQNDRGEINDLQSKSAEIEKDKLLLDTLEIIQKSLKEQNLQISNDGWQTLKNELQAASLKPAVMTDEIAEFNQSQPFENRISIENKTGLEVFHEYLTKGDTNEIVAEVAEFSSYQDEERELLNSRSNDTEEGGISLEEAIRRRMPNLNVTIDF